VEFEKRFMYETDAKRPECHAATVAALPSGDLLGAWYAGTREGAADVAILAARWVRKTKEWQEARAVVDTPGLPEGNPVLFVDGSGYVWLFYVTLMGDGWVTSCLKAMRSEDEGQTWGRPVVFDEPQGTMPRNKPLCPDDDTVLLPLYDEATWRGFVYISTDRCVSWRRSGWIEAPTGCIQPTLFSRPDGVIVAFLRDRARKNVWRSESHDGGETWAPCVATPLPNPNAAVDTVLLDSGNLVVAFNDSREKRTPLSLAWSDDYGETWRIKVDIETEEAEFSYPAIIQDRAGLIHVAYTWRRKAIAHCVLDEDWILKNGVSYQPP
jgi:predicted neuraminidase